MNEEAVFIKVRDRLVRLDAIDAVTPRYAATETRPAETDVWLRGGKVVAVIGTVDDVVALMEEAINA